MRIPIYVRQVVFTVLILLSAAVPITYKSSTLFEAESKRREDSTNMDAAIARSKEMNQILNYCIEKTFNIGEMIIQTLSDSTDETRKKIEASLARDNDLFAVDVYTVINEKTRLLKRVTNEERFAEYKYDSTYIDQLRKSQNFPLQSLLQNKIELQNSSVPKGIPLFTIGLPLVKDRDGNVTHMVVADYALSKLQKSFLMDSTHILFLTDAKGNVLAHQDEAQALGRANLKSQSFVAEVLTKNTPRFQKRYYDQEKKGYFYGAAASSVLDTFVFSQTSEDVILEPSRQTRREGIFITGLVVSASLIAIFLFSMTFTKPIEILSTMVKVVARGNFSVSARRLIKSKDEVGSLAIAFDQMTEGLKERDKVKTLFSKFHGSSIAEDLINKRIGIGGANKEVTVFFSDIRGFTQFSESRTPEEVVEMLNEYFGIMVRIIQQNHGIVDKFIGDAIMAVWGAPKGTNRDAANAVRACLEMRKSLEELNKKRIARNMNPITIGMGVHSGRAISGTIGSDERMEYTVIGDTVNMASRIESSTKAFGADLLISESTANAVNKEFALELAGAAEVKGKSEPLKLFKVVGYVSKTGEITTVKTPYSDYKPEKADKVKIA